MIRLFNHYVSLKSILLALVELISITLALLGGASVRFWNNPAEFEAFVRFPGFPLQILIVCITLQLCFYYNQWYDFTSLRGRNDLWICLGQSLGQGSVLLGILYFLVPSLMIGRGVFFISIVLGTGLIVVGRIALDSTWQAAPRQRILILGTGPLAVSVARELTSREDLNVAFMGFVDAASGSESLIDSPEPKFKLLGRLPDLDSIVYATQAARIVVALEERRQILPIRELVKLRVSGVIVEDAHTTMSVLTGRVWLQMIRPSWFVFSEGFHRSVVLLSAKRLVDLFCATVGLLLTLPVMAIVAVAIRLDSKGPIIYRQRRVGMRGKYFYVLKFRSMQTNAEQDGVQWAAVDDPRVTTVGKYLRKFRLDELPQFINVLRGDMSFVGPRPERPEFVDKLQMQIPYYDERHSVRPGITGWAQVQYSYGASTEDAYRKLEYDLFYLKHMSIMFDIAIIFHTVRTMISGHGGR